MKKLLSKISKKIEDEELTEELWGQDGVYADKHGEDSNLFWQKANETRNRKRELIKLKKSLEQSKKCLDKIIGIYTYEKKDSFLVKLCKKLIQ